MPPKVRKAHVVRASLFHHLPLASLSLSLCLTQGCPLNTRLPFRLNPRQSQTCTSKTPARQVRRARPSQGIVEANRKVCAAVSANVLRAQQTVVITFSTEREQREQRGPDLTAVAADVECTGTGREPQRGEERQGWAAQPLCFHTHTPAVFHISNAKRRPLRFCVWFRGLIARCAAPIPEPDPRCPLLCCAV